MKNFSPILNKILFTWVLFEAVLGSWGGAAEHKEPTVQVPLAEVGEIKEDFHAAQSAKGYPVVVVKGPDRRPAFLSNFDFLRDLGKITQKLKQESIASPGGTEKGYTPPSASQERIKPTLPSEKQSSDSASPSKATSSDAR
jgi:hypothetical protein